MARPKAVFSQSGTRNFGGKFCRLVETTAVECLAALREQMGSYIAPSETGLFQAHSPPALEEPVPPPAAGTEYAIKITIW